MALRAHDLLVGFALAIPLLSVPLDTHASTFIQVDVPTLNRMSEAVVQARVVDITSAWNEDASMIFSHVTLAVGRRLRGSAEDRVVVRVPGGTVNGFHAEMEGAPEFRRNDDVVVFLGRWPDGAPMVAGYAQGLSRVLRDASGNESLSGGVADGKSIAALARELNPSR